LFTQIQQATPPNFGYHPFGDGINRREFIAASASALVLDPLRLEPPGMNPLGDTGLDREIMWQSHRNGTSLELARLVKTDSGPEICGIVLMSQNNSPLRVDYWIACGPNWETKRVQIEQTWHGIRRSVRLEQVSQGEWSKSGNRAAELAGCTDVDLGITASTNALAINRLRLPVGSSSEIRAAWVRFPELTITPAPQKYQRVSQNQYEYLSLTGDFKALLSVDKDGMPVEYEGIWHQIATGPGPEGKDFASALISRRPSPELGEMAQALGWLVGGWSAQVRDFDPDGTVRQSSGEWWFSWVLEGRAIQDVFIVPPRTERQANRNMSSGSSTRANNRYGTTVRWFDQQRGLWRLVWVNPVSGALNVLGGKREGDCIVLEGIEGDVRIRWSFNEIKPDSFIWRGETYENNNWRLGAEFRLRRIA
jgi:uncharacterized protein